MKCIVSSQNYHGKSKMAIPAGDERRDIGYDYIHDYHGRR